jgi:uncharacterized membrane protein
MKNKEILWLYSELPKLVSNGILSNRNAEDLKNYYGELEKKDFTQVLFTVFGVIGAIFIGLGIILIFAFNWNELPRFVRTILSFLPLFVCQIVTLWVFVTKYSSVSFRETCSTLLMLSIGAAISLISQTYHISGDFAAFLLNWMLLSLPLIYLLDVNTPALFYLIGITGWSGYAQFEGRQAALFWLLLLLIVPRLIVKYRENRYSNTSVYLSWLLIACLSVATGITLEKVMPGLWIIIYAAFFVNLYLIGKLFFAEAPAIILKPFHTVGTLGIIIMALLLTYTWPWREIGWNNLRFAERFNQQTAIIDYLIALGSIVSIGGLMVNSYFKKQKTNLFYSSFCFITIGCYCLTAMFFDSKNYQTSKDELTVLIFIHLVYNAYLLLLGISGIILGTKLKKLQLINGGTLLIALLIALRFIFVEDFLENLIVRGIIFISLGICFFIANLIFSKILKGKEAV